jgi:hypothetical protein
MLLDGFSFTNWLASFMEKMIREMMLGERASQLSS